MPRKAVSPATQQRRASQALQAIHQVIRSTCPNEDIAAAITCALPVYARYGLKIDDSWEWLEQAEDPWFRETLPQLRKAYHRRSAAIQQAIQEIQIAFGSDTSVLLWHLVELLLSSVSAGTRRATGTFYTPPEIARYLVQQVDSQTRQVLGSPGGLADRTFPGIILEPACGSGVFLAAVLKHCRAETGWNEETAGHLVRRLAGVDLSPVALFLCRLRLAVLLRSSGIALTREFPQPSLCCANVLAGPDQVAALRGPIAVVVGNPPFSSLSRNEQPWIQSLIRGGEEHAGYFAIDGETLGEKKTWLHDDYVKFLRLAQWAIAENGRGVVSLVTNHGWLDNATFRIARRQLLRTFSQIEVVDLHGNAKRHEANPEGERDENVFGIAQGIALVTLTKTGSEHKSLVSRSDLWGSRTAKLQRLSQAAEGEALAKQLVVPTTPWFAFAEQAAPIPREFLAAPPLTDLMPVNSTVPVTARDHFVVARTREELLERIDVLNDPHISDDEIRARYFQRTRSQRYESGDTRSWKLSAARRLVRDAGDPQQFIRRCLYRPFVWRYVFWHPAMIDWPRTEFSRHLQAGNLALLARRQSIAGRECNFFWVTDFLPLDGVIRSDNRGSESFFPLWLNGNDGARRANFAESLLEQGRSPQELFAWCYGLFHSREYRTRFASGLAQEFPRVLWPHDAELFTQIAQIGKQLINLHLTDPLKNSDFDSQISNSRFAVCNRQSAIEAFHVGTYNVCRKWLQMEKQSRESPAFARLQQLIAATIDLQDQIDESIQRAGGLPGAFR